MKKPLLVLAFLFCAVSPCVSTAHAETPFVTGKDWVERMNDQEKFLSLAAPLLLFHKYGVSLTLTPPEYIEKIDQVLLTNPYLEKEEVANIFASTVYAYEPHTREALEYMARELYDRKMGYRLSPNLRIRPVPEARAYDEE